MTDPQRERLATVIERFYKNAPSIRQMDEDPIAFPHRYADPKDIEVVGWLSAALALGRVSLFRAVTEKILKLMRDTPYHYLMTFDPHRERPKFTEIYYRFYTGDDLFSLVSQLSRAVREFGTLRALFTSLYREEEGDIGPSLSRFVARMRSFITATPPSLIPSPASGSACKRLNLYLRWMVRPNDGVDFGLWKEIPPSQLIVPLDTHIVRISRYLGLTKRLSPNWLMAKEITENLKRFDPIDPLKYDFALCHLGISGACPIQSDREKCKICPLLSACKRGRRLIR